jgi:hypothetical protein
MPGDLYNLNSAYGTEDELKQCIAEMHNHNILVREEDISLWVTQFAHCFQNTEFLPSVLVVHFTFHIRLRR